MCRLLAYIGHPALLADVVLWPDRSIIKQSYDARERIRDPTLPFHLGHGNLNGDGFGIGWFSDDAQRETDPSPCVFTSITPAWNNENLARLSCKIISPLVFAHVRAAYPGMPVSEQNCHPFQWGRYLWMHNGVMGGFSQIKRSLLADLSDTAYNTIQSFHSDSAVSFAVFLNHLPDLTSQHSPDVLLKAMHDTLAYIARVQHKHGVTATSLLNFVASDGVTLIATRYVFPETESPPSLYYAEGADFVRKLDGKDSAEGEAGEGRQAGCRNPNNPGCKLSSSASQLRGSSVLQEAPYSVTFGERGASVVLIASEPITGSTTDWVSVPRNTALIITREKSGYLNIMRSPLTPAAGLEGVAGVDPKAEVSRCLEAVSRGLHEQASLWAPPSRSLSNVDAPEAPVAEVEQHRLTGHSGPVLAVELDPDVPRMYTSSTDCTIKVWDLEQGVCIRSLVGHRKPVVSLQMSGGRLLSIGGKIVKIWDLDTFDCVYTLNCSSEAGFARAFRVLPDNQIFIGSQDSTIRSLFLDPSHFHPTEATTSPASSLPVPEPHLVTDPLAGHVGAVNALAVCGGYICSGGADAMVRVWHAHDLSPAGVLRGHRGSIICLLAVGNQLLTGARDNTIRVWDMETGMLCRKTLSGHKDDVTALATVRMAATPPTSHTTYRAGFNSHTHTTGTFPLPHSSTSTSSTNTPASTTPSSPRQTPRPANRSINNPRAVFSNPYSGAQLEPHVESADSASSSTYSDPAFASSDSSSDLDSPRPTPLDSPASSAQCSPSRLGPRSLSAGTRHPSNTNQATSAPSATYTLVASSSADGTVRVWTMQWVCIRIFSVGSDVPSVLQPLPSGLQMASSLNSPSLQKWLSGRFGQDPPLSPALAVAMSSKHVACGYADGCVRLWRTDDLHVTTQEAYDDDMLGGLGCGLAQPMSTARTTDELADSVEADEDDLLQRQLSSSCPTPSFRIPATAVPMLHRRGKLSACSPNWLQKMKAFRKAYPQETIEHELERALREFVRFRTVSADAKLREECFRGAKYLARLLESLGADIKLVRSSEERNPLVLGRLGDNPSRPTITFYGHYDVQPAAEPDWRTNPFELAAVDGYLYGRGTSDNKGPILAFVFAVKELLDRYAGQAESGGLPFNIAFLFEGEEEVGSVGFAEALQQNLHWFEGTRVVVMSNTLWVGEQKPCLTYGMRGMLALSVEVSGPERELHSGNDGGVFNEPMLDLVKLAASLSDSRSNIQIPGFYQEVQPGLLDLAWPRLQASHEFSAEGYLNALGVPALTAPSNTCALLKARWCQPSLSIVDMRPAYGARKRAGPPSCGHPQHNCSVEFAGGSPRSRLHGGPGVGGPAPGMWLACGMQRSLESSWVAGAGGEAASGCVSSLFSFGPTRFSVIPNTAVAKISVRYVPKQDASHLINSLKLHVESEFHKLGSANDVAIHVESVGDWWEADSSSQVFHMAEAAIKREWGTEPLYVREGGTMPVASLIEKVLGAPALMIPMGQSSDNCHLANERIRRSNLLRGKNVIRNLLEELAALGTESG